ncbi:MAG: hypothetical protein ACP5R2_13205 [Anaerolineae bacterium]
MGNFLKNGQKASPSVTNLDVTLCQQRLFSVFAFFAGKSVRLYQWGKGVYGLDHLRHTLRLAKLLISSEERTRLDLQVWPHLTGFQKVVRRIVFGMPIFRWTKQTLPQTEMHPSQCKN